MTKVISLSEEAYTEMKALKEEDESFSDVALRFAEIARKKPLTEFFGKWPGSSEEAEAIKQRLYKERKQVKTREVKF